MTSDTERHEHPSLPAAYTYFGQMLTHDLSFDPATMHQRQDDPDSLHNVRTPAFDLDCVYGRGPADQPYLYDRSELYRLLTGSGVDRAEFDVPRNSQGAALVGDPRQDETLLLSQLHIVFLELHNRLLDEEHRKTDDDLPTAAHFTEAQRLTRWHYQWLVLHDYLPRILDPEVMGRLRRVIEPDRPWHASQLRHFRPRLKPFVPIEFAAAAFRFGHALIRDNYELNPLLHDKREQRPIPIFGESADESLNGGRPLPAGWHVAWPRLLDLDSSDYQRAFRIGPKLSPCLGALPLPDGRTANLALLDLVRGFEHQLPSGQAMAQAMGLPDILSADASIFPGPETPLWLYVLEEAQQQYGGERLGRLGSEIVGEVLVGLVRHDPFSYLALNPRWRPCLPSRGRFELSDLVRWALHYGSDS
ncbi:MAG: peroxidase family protein [Actinomycetota bacterium]